MTAPMEPGIPEWPHKPAPPEPRRLLPEWPLLSRGLALGAAAATLLAGSALAVRRGPLTAVAIAPAMTVVAALFAWAAAIHLSGGEKFDDHRWV